MAVGRALRLQQVWWPGPMLQDAEGTPAPQPWHAEKQERELRLSFIQPLPLAGELPVAPPQTLMGPRAPGSLAAGGGGGAAPGVPPLPT